MGPGSKNTDSTMTQAREEDRGSLFVIAYSLASCIKTLDSYYSLLLPFM